jgi:hypothetical protein
MEFKIRFNTNFQNTEGLFWRVLIDDVEFLASDVEILNVKVTTKTHILDSGEKKWSISCISNNYSIDSDKKIIIYMTVQRKHRSL